MDYFKKIKKNILSDEGGYSLIELLISITLFVLVIGINTNIFINSIKGQQKAIATQNVSNSARYSMEVMAREIRVGRVGSFVLNGANDITFVSGSENRKDGLGNPLTVRFYLNAGRVLFDDDTSDANAAAPITSFQNVNIDSLNFILSNVLTQPKITISLTASSNNGSTSVSSDTALQTTISPREINL